MGFFTEDLKDTMTVCERKYTDYINEHISNINKAFNQYGEYLANILEIDLYELQMVIQNHDKSKFSKNEFSGYANYFFAGSNEEKEINKPDMDVAWLHHMNNNQHHPEYWILRDSDGIRPLEMPDIYIAEMILDWTAMGYKFNNTAYDWFNKKEEYYKKCMHSSTFAKTKMTIKELYKEDK